MVLMIGCLLRCDALCSCVLLHRHIMMLICSQALLGHFVECGCSLMIHALAMLRKVIALMIVMLMMMVNREAFTSLAVL